MENYPKHKFDYSKLVDYPQISLYLEKIDWSYLFDGLFIFRSLIEFAIPVLVTLFNLSATTIS